MEKVTFTLTLSHIAFTNTNTETMNKINFNC